MLAERVQARLETLGLSANKASVEAGLGRDYVRDIIRGKVREPSADRLRRLAFVLRCSPLYLLGETGDVGSPKETARPQTTTLPILYQIRPGFHPNDDGAIREPRDWPSQTLTINPTHEWLEYVRDPERGWPVPEGSLLHVSADAIFLEAVMQEPRLLVITRQAAGGLVERSVRRFDLVDGSWSLLSRPDDPEPLPVDQTAFAGRAASGIKVEGEVLAIYQFLGRSLPDAMRA